MSNTSLLTLPRGADVPTVLRRPGAPDLALYDDRALPAVHGGAITASGLYVLTFKDMWDNSDLVLDYISDTIKAALYTNSVTPNFSTDTAYAASPYTSNEVTGTGYTAGGATLGTKTLTDSSGTLVFDAADPSWTTATFSAVRGMLVWDDTVTTPVADPVIGLVNFGSDYAVTAGTFTVQLSGSGLFTIDLTP